MNQYDASEDERDQELDERDQELNHYDKNKGERDKELCLYDKKAGPLHQKATTRHMPMQYCWEPNTHSGRTRAASGQEGGKASGGNMQLTLAFTRCQLLGTHAHPLRARHSRQHSD